MKAQAEFRIAGRDRIIARRDERHARARGIALDGAYERLRSIDQQLEDPRRQIHTGARLEDLTMLHLGDVAAGA